MLKINKAETFPLEVAFCWPSKKDPQLEGTVTAHVRLLEEKEREEQMEAARQTGKTLAEFRVLVPRIDGIPGDDGQMLEGDALFEWLAASKYGGTIISSITAELLEHQREGKARTSWRSLRR